MHKTIFVTIAALIIAVPSAAQQPIPPILVKQFNDGENWILAEPVVYQIGNSAHRIEVPKGFVTDFASIPYGVTAFFLPTGQYARAAVVHDYLYWSQTCSRAQADLIFLLAMVESNVPFATRRGIYRTVRAGGEGAWTDNQNQRKAGLPRVIPEPYLQIGPLDVWVSYRKRLYDNNVRPEATVPRSPTYCSATEQDLR